MVTRLFKKRIVKSINLSSVTRNYRDMIQPTIIFLPTTSF